MTFENIMRAAQDMTITEVGARLLFESHSFDGYSEYTRRGDVYAVLVTSGEGAIEFAIVTKLKPFTLEGITGATTNLMSQIATGEVEVLGRLTRVEESLILNVASLEEWETRAEDGCGTCPSCVEDEADLVN
jgi:hypothetical protein